MLELVPHNVHGVMKTQDVQRKAPPHLFIITNQHNDKVLTIVFVPLLADIILVTSRKRCDPVKILECLPCVTQGWTQSLWGSHTHGYKHAGGSTVGRETVGSGSSNPIGNPSQASVKEVPIGVTTIPGGRVVAGGINAALPLPLKAVSRRRVSLAREARCDPGYGSLKDNHLKIR